MRASDFELFEPGTHNTNRWAYKNDTDDIYIYTFMNSLITIDMIVPERSTIQYNGSEIISFYKEEKESEFIARSNKLTFAPSNYQEFLANRNQSTSASGGSGGFFYSNQIPSSPSPLQPRTGASFPAANSQTFNQPFKQGQDPWAYGYNEWKAEWDSTPLEDNSPKCDCGGWRTFGKENDSVVNHSPWCDLIEKKVL